MKPKLLALAAILSLCFTAVTELQAGLKERMQKRLPAINKMKAAGLIGENNTGFIEVRKKLSDEDRRTIDEENADRKAVYALLAKKNGLTVEAVGKLRAKKIAETTAKGYWLQKPDGTWYQK